MEPISQQRSATQRATWGISAVVLTLTLAVGLSFHELKQANSHLHAQLDDAQRFVTTARVSLARQADRCQALEARIEQLSRRLNETTTVLSPAPLALDGSTMHKSQSLDRPTALRQLKELNIPIPVAAIVSNAFGGMTETWLIPQLAARNGRPLTTEVRFSNIYGRRLVFHSHTGQPLAFDVDEIHPAILACLAITPANARQAQADIDRQKLLRTAAAEGERLARDKAALQLRETEVRLLTEQRKLEESRMQAQGDQQAKQLSAATERLLALAERTAAEAAYARAFAPEPYYSWWYPVHTWHFIPVAPCANQISVRSSFRFRQPFRFLPPSQYSPAAAGRFASLQPSAFQMVQVAR